MSLIVQYEICRPGSAAENEKVRAEQARVLWEINEWIRARRRPR